jgi:hypothetical protein
MKRLCPDHSEGKTWMGSRFGGISSCNGSAFSLIMTPSLGEVGGFPSGMSNFNRKNARAVIKRNEHSLRSFI